ncbi:unnamed protein product [Effrenium voratum]|nr:unnamed protein product [Effrenium voratum]
MRAPMERVLIAAAVGAAALFPSAALFAVPRVPLEQPSFSRAQGGSPPLSVALGSVSLSLAVAFAAVRPLSRRMAGSTLAATKLRSRATRVACRAMFERFSPGSMKAVMLAQGESRNLGHDYVGAEMLVVGILAEGNERGSRALEAAGIKLQEAKAKLREMVGTGGGGKENAEIPLTQEAMKVLEEAGDMSKREDCAMAARSMGSIAWAAWVERGSRAVECGECVRRETPRACVRQSAGRDRPRFPRSFSNTLVVMTSNLGSRSVQKGAGGGLGLGFGTEEDSSERSYNAIREAVHEEMKSFFRPEFLNRLDEICVFRPLTKEGIRAIAEVEFNKVAERLLQELGCTCP